MTAVSAFGIVFGVGVLMLLTAQPHGAARASMAQRLRALDPQVEPEAPGPRVRVFRTDVFEQFVRPQIERAGDGARALVARFGLDLRTTEQRLRLAADPGGLGLFLGEKLACGLLGLVALPLLASFGAAPTTPIVLWLATAAGAFILPDAVLRSRAHAAHLELRDQLVAFTETLTLAVSAGLGLEGALDHVTEGSRGRLCVEARRLLRLAPSRRETATAALARLPSEIGLPEAEPVAMAIATADKHGTPIIQALRAQARSLRERRRIELIEAGERAQVRMLLPVGLLILPAFFLVVLYPAAVSLLRITNG